MHKTTTSQYKEGISHGIPIALGYLFVSTGFGITAVNMDLSPFTAVLISLTNVTSAGQVAGLRILTESSVFTASALEMILTQFVINLRYSLMGVSLSQKTDPNFDIKHRMICSFSITDEIYAVASTRPGLISVPYFLGLSTLPILGWATGTAIGAFLGTAVPVKIASIFGIAIYGMFLSIFVPPSKKDKGVLFCILISCLISCTIFYLPQLRFISSGFAIIISAIVSSAVISLFFPRNED